MGDVTSQSALALGADRWADDGANRVGTGGGLEPRVEDGNSRRSSGADTIVHDQPGNGFYPDDSVDGLASATRYRWYVFVGTKGRDGTSTEARVAAQGEFTTLPDTNSHLPVTIAWSGDLGGQGRCRRGAAGYPIFDVMRAQQLDFFLFLGDTVYSDNVCPSPPNEPGADFRATTLAEYRARHRDQRGAEALRRFLDSVPIYVIWDDHEVRNNFAGPFDSQMPAGRQALREYWPVRVAPDDPHRLYRTVRAGADLEVFILDTRQYRSRNADQDGPAKTMLGEKQLQWL